MPFGSPVSENDTGRLVRGHVMRRLNFAPDRYAGGSDRAEGSRRGMSPQLKLRRIERMEVEGRKALSRLIVCGCLPELW